MATENPAYKVLKHDAIAHAVYDKKTKITGCVIYEAGELNLNVIKEVSQPVMIMYNKEDRKLQITICQPDLKWGHKRPESYVYLTLKGNWKTNQSQNVSLVSSKNNETLLKISSLAGRSVSFTSVKR